MTDVVNPAQPLTASGQVKDSNGTVLPKGGYFRCAVLNPATTVCRVIIYDNTTGSGRVLADVAAAANDKSTASPDYRIPFSIGLYAVISGAPTSVLVYYE